MIREQRSTLTSALAQSLFIPALSLQPIAFSRAEEQTDEAEEEMEGGGEGGVKTVILTCFCVDQISFFYHFPSVLHAISILHWHA